MAADIAGMESLLPALPSLDVEEVSTEDVAAMMFAPPASAGMQGEERGGVEVESTGADPVDGLCDGMAVAGTAHGGTDVMRAGPSGAGSDEAPELFGLPVEPAQLSELPTGGGPAPASGSTSGVGKVASGGSKMQLNKKRRIELHN
eukprot:COSAG04_NODE_14804_length_554_cov_1.468132_1_plen_145_part_01